MRIRKRTQDAATPEVSPDAKKLEVDSINESTVIAAVIVSEEARRKYLKIPADRFRYPGHADAWTLLQDLFARGMSYDPVAVHNLSGGKVDGARLDAYVQARPELPPNLRHYVDQLYWDATRIDAAKGPVNELIEAMRDPSANPDKVRQLARTVASAFDGHGSSRYLRNSADVVSQHREVLNARRLGRRSYPYGIDGLDLYGPDDYAERDGKQRCLDGTPRLIPGAGPGMMSIVTGISGSGKSTSVAKMALYWARQKEKTLWGAWEVEGGASLELVAAMDLGWSRSDVMTGDFSEEEQAELLQRMEELGQWIKFMELPFDRKVGDRGLRNERNLDVLQQHIADEDPAHFIADLFNRALTETKPEEEARAVYRMQAILQEQKVHGLLTHQLTLKDIEQREDPRPTRDSLKGTAAYVEAADTIKAWYRPFLHKSVPDTKVECHVLKQRYGKWPQVTEHDWDAEFGTIENGHTIEVSRPGEKGAVDNYLDESLAGPKKGKPRSSRRRI
jgi:hypothetical protein